MRIRLFDLSSRERPRSPVSDKRTDGRLVSNLVSWDRLEGQFQVVKFMNQLLEFLSLLCWELRDLNSLHRILSIKTTKEAKCRLWGANNGCRVRNKSWKKEAGV